MRPRGLPTATQHNSVMFRHGGILSFRRLSSRLLELKTGHARVLVKHTDRIEREFVKVFASELN
jgi:hypothetical protein